MRLFRYLYYGFLLWVFAWAIASTFGATGDILDIQINTDGWSSSNVVSGLGTGGTYANGLGATAGLVITNMLTGSEKYVLNVTSSGYDATGTATTYKRKVYGTKFVRIAGTSSPDESTGAGGNLTNRFALSDWIYSSDTVTSAVSAGWVTQGGNPNNAYTGNSVANNSPYAYPLVIGNWSRPNFRKITATTMRLGFVAFHAFPRNGKPVACVKFIVSDQHSHTVTNIETVMRIDRSLGETIPSAEYYTDIDCSAANFTAGDRLTCDVQAFPWIGTSTAILDTAVVRGWEGARWSWHPITQTNVYDPNGTYAPFIAVVDAVNGSDSNGRATNTTPANVNSAHYFLTIANAVLRIQNSNNASATPTHNDPGGGIVYLHSNVTNSPGATPAIARSSCEVIFSPYPGEAVTINKATSAASEQFGYHLRWTNVMFAASGSDSYAPAPLMEQVVLDNCTISNTASVFDAGVTNFWVINSHVIANSQNFTWALSDPMGYLWRNCWFDGYGGNTMAYLMMGCHRDSTNGYNFTIANDVASLKESRGDFAVIYNNKIGGLSIGTSGTYLGIGNNYGISNGVAIVQNVFEYCTNTAGVYGSSQITVDTLDHTNILLFNNIELGKTLWFYNWTGTAASWKVGCFGKNNVVEDMNIKSDNFTTTNANRVGNWSIMLGVGWTGNCFLETTNTIIGAVGEFLPEFSGLNTVGGNISFTAPQRPASFMQWVNPQYWDGSAQNSWPGGGLYRVKSNSSAQNMNMPDVIIPFDLEGNPRGALDPPGAYASASPRKGAGFFGQ